MTTAIWVVTCVVAFMCGCDFGVKFERRRRAEKR